MMCFSISFWVYHLIQQTCHDCWAKGRCDCQEMYGHGLDSDALVFTLYTFVSVNWFMDLGWFWMSSFIYGPFFGAKIHGGHHKVRCKITSEVDMSSYTVLYVFCEWLWIQKGGRYPKNTGCSPPVKGRVRIIVWLYLRLQVLYGHLGVVVHGTTIWDKDHSTSI